MSGSSHGSKSWSPNRLRGQQKSRFAAVARDVFANDRATRPGSAVDVAHSEILRRYFEGSFSSSNLSLGGSIGPGHCGKIDGYQMNARIGVAAAAVLLFSASVAVAGPRDDALNAVAKCALLKDDHARLACYDTAASRIKDALAAPPEPQAAATEEQQKSWFGLSNLFGGGGRPPQTSAQQFGNEALPPPPPPAPVPGQPAPPPPPTVIDSITAGVTDYAFNPVGRFTVFLDNGQIWNQVPGDSNVARFKKSGPNSVTISRGLFGSYNLRVSGYPAIFKVTRLK
jgi:hypothetical protein